MWGVGHGRRARSPRVGGGDELTPEKGRGSTQSFLKKKMSIKTNAEHRFSFSYFLINI